MLDAGRGGDHVLEFLHVPPVVREPPPIENVIHTVEQARTVAEVRPPDMDRLRKGRRASEDRKISD
jgi:hypothetical protein